MAKTTKSRKLVESGPARIMYTVHEDKIVSTTDGSGLADLFVLLDSNLIPTLYKNLSDYDRAGEIGNALREEAAVRNISLEHVLVSQDSTNTNTESGCEDAPNMATKAVLQADGSAALYDQNGNSIGSSAKVFSNGQQIVDVVVTEDTLTLNPDMSEDGLKVGDTIKVTAHPQEDGESGVIDNGKVDDNNVSDFENATNTESRYVGNYKSHNVAILSVRYEEPTWQETKLCIEATGLPVHYVDRKPKGFGSLAEAINRGFAEMDKSGIEYVWIVTNIVFEPSVIEKLLSSIKVNAECGPVAAICPAYASDHSHLCPDEPESVKDVPFIEFTCPLVSIEAMSELPLDNAMPYWGHDLDWSYRAQMAGYRLLINMRAQITHEYIRYNFKKHQVTMKRYRSRRMMDRATSNALAIKYGTQWRDVIYPKTDKQIGAFYEEVKNKVL